MDISALLRILMARAKAGTASFLGYPLTVLFITKVLYNFFIFKDCDKLSSSKHNKIVCLYGFSQQVLIGRVNNKPLALNSHVNNVENQYIIHLCTNYCYCINICAVS